MSAARPIATALAPRPTAMVPADPAAHMVADIMARMAREISVVEMPATRNGRPIRVVARQTPAPRKLRAAMAVEETRAGATPLAIMAAARKHAPRAAGAQPAAAAEVLAAAASAVEGEVAEDFAVVEAVAADAVEQ